MQTISSSERRLGALVSLSRLRSTSQYTYIYTPKYIYIYIYASLAHVGAFSNAASRSVRGQRKSAWAFQMTFPSLLYFGVFFLSPQYTICEKDDEGGDDEDEMRVGGSVGGGVRNACFSEEYFELYKQYLGIRHANGGMDNPAPEDFERFLLNPWGETLFVEVSLAGRVIAVAVTDATADGLSAVYTFFNPEYQSRALGKFCILQQIELCRTMNIRYLYLGYWVDGCQKMQYKTDFGPQEHFDGHDWIEQ